MSHANAAVAFEPVEPVSSSLMAGYDADMRVRPALALVPAAPAPMQPTAATPDMARAVGGCIVASYAALMAAFWLIFAKGGSSSFVLTISALYLIIYLYVPRLFLKLQPGQQRLPTFAGFLNGDMDTHSGPMSGGAALGQMIIVPVALSVGVLLMGLAISLTAAG